MLVYLILGIFLILIGDWIERKKQYNNLRKKLKEKMDKYMENELIDYYDNAANHRIIKLLTSVTSIGLYNVKIFIKSRNSKLKLFWLNDADELQYQIIDSEPKQQRRFGYKKAFFIESSAIQSKSKKIIITCESNMKSTLNAVFSNK